MSVHTHYTQTASNSHCHIPINNHALATNFQEELDEFTNDCMLNACNLSLDEIQAINHLLSITPFEGSDITLIEFICSLRNAIEKRIRKNFSIYLRGSKARELMNLIKQLDGIIRTYKPQLTTAWVHERGKLPPLPSPNDVDFLLYTEQALSSQELVCIVEEIGMLTKNLLGNCKRYPKAIEKNSMNETEEPLVLAKINDFVDITAGTMTQIRNLFTLDAPILLVDPRCRFYSALSINKNIFWRGIADALFKKVRLESRHKMDFFAFLAAIQHATNGYEVIEQTCSLKEIAAHFLAKPNVTVDMICFAIRDRIKQHRVEGFSFLFNACACMPKEGGKRDAIWRQLAHEYSSKLPLEESSFDAALCELYYLKMACPNHPCLKDISLLFPHYFELKPDLALRSKMERHLFLSFLNNTTKYHIEGSENPYCELLFSLTAMTGRTGISQKLIAKILDWIPHFTDQDYAEVLKRLRLPKDTKREECAYRLLSTPSEFGAISHLKKNHPEWSPEERFCHLAPFLKHKTKLRLFAEIKNPSLEFLLTYAKQNMHEQFFHNILPEVLQQFPKEERAKILEKFPQKYWMHAALDPGLFSAETARPLLQKLYADRPTLELLWKSEERGILLDNPRFTKRDLQQQPQKVIFFRTKFLLENNRIEELEQILPYLNEDRARELNYPAQKKEILSASTPKMTLEQAIEQLIDNPWHPESLSTLTVLLERIALLPDESQFSPLLQLISLHREEFRDKALEKLVVLLQNGSEKERLCRMVKLPLKLRERVLLERQLLSEESSLKLLQEIYQERPHLSLYWHLEENGVKIAKPKKSSFNSNLKPSTDRVIRRLNYLLQMKRLSEHFETAIEFQADEEQLEKCFDQVMRLENIHQLPKILTKSHANVHFMKRASEKWMEEMLRALLTKPQALALLKVLSLKDYQDHFRKQLLFFSQILIENPISFEIYTDLLQLIIETKDLYPLLEHLLPRLRKEESYPLTQMLDSNKFKLFSLCADSGSMLYELISLFNLKGIRFEAILPSTFGAVLVKKFKETTPHERLLAIKIAFTQLEKGNVNWQELAVPLFEVIFHLNHQALFRQWMQQQQVKPVKDISQLLFTRFEWMVELVLQGSQELLPHCLAHPDLGVETLIKLYPLMERHLFNDSNLLCSFLKRFPGEIESLTRYFIYLHTKGTLDELGTEKLLLLASELINEGNPELIMRAPSLFTSHRNLGERAIRICLPALLSIGDLQTASRWIEHINGVDSAILILWLSKMEENSNGHPPEMYCALIQALSEKIDTNPLSQECIGTAISFINRLTLTTDINSIQEALCLLAERLISKSCLTPSQEIALYKLLAASKKNINLERCRTLLENLEEPHGEFVYTVLTAAAESDDELEACMQALSNSSIFLNGFISKDEIECFSILIRVPRALQTNDKEAILNAIEQIIYLNKNPNRYKFQRYSSVSAESILVVVLNYLLSVGEFDHFEKSLYLYFISKIFPTSLFSSIRGKETKIDILFAFISLLHQTQKDPNKTHSIIDQKLVHIFSQVIPRASLLCQPYLAGMMGALLANCINSPHAEQKHYAQSIESIFKEFYYFPESTEIIMSRLDTLFNKIIDRRFFFSYPSTLIRYELWMCGSSERSRSVIKRTSFFDAFFPAFKNQNCDQISHRKRLMASVIYGLSFPGLEEKRALDLLKYYINTVLKIEPTPKDSLTTNIRRILDINQKNVPFNTRQKILQYINNLPN